MQLKVEQRELQLPRAEQPGLETARVQQALEQLCRERFAGIHMARQQRQRFGPPAPLFHDLARQFHRIPSHAVDARQTRVVDAREQVVQGMAEFVEQRRHIVVCQQRGLAGARRGEVANHIRHRQRGMALQRCAADAFAHPSATALARACV